jgi:hypothetical protein
MTTRRIYLDVDGVLNAVRARFPSETESGWSEDSWRLQEINGFPIRWSTELVDELNTLVADGAEIRWLTTWCELAGEMIAPALGLKGGEDWLLTDGVTTDLRMMADFGRRGWWKLDAFERDAADLVENGGKAVWLDDDHAHERINSYDGLRSRLVEDLGRGGQLLLFAPFTDTGLTRKDLESIRAFFEEDTV